MDLTGIKRMCPIKEGGTDIKVKMTFLSDKVENNVIASV